MFRYINSPCILRFVRSFLFSVTQVKYRGGAYKKNWDWFRTQGFVSIIVWAMPTIFGIHVAYNHAQAPDLSDFDVKIWPIWSFSKSLISDLKSFISTAPGLCYTGTSKALIGASIEKENACIALISSFTLGWIPSRMSCGEWINQEVSITIALKQICLNSLHVE